jgi:branched-chain amino acid transport system substrate-binding protein
VASERFANTDTSVTGQVLRILSRNPDAVLIGGSGTPAVLPQRTLRERGYCGIIYQTHGVANPDFLRVGGDVVVGTRLPAGPVTVFDQLPLGFPTRSMAQQYVQAYETRFGIGSFSIFGAQAYDATLILRSALERTLRRVQLENLMAFRAALREEIEPTRNLVGTNGVFNFTPTDHLGLRFQETAVLIQVVRDSNGKLDWKLERTFR